MDTQRAATPLDRMLASARPGPCSTIVGADIPARVRAAFDSPAANVKPPAYLTGAPHPALDPANALPLRKEI